MNPRSHSTDPTGDRSDRRVRAVPVDAQRGALRPLGIDEVTLTDGFWGRRQELNASATIGHVERWLERSGWIANFDAATEGRLPDDRRGREFSDSEVYKLLEAMAWELGRRHDADLEAHFHAIVARVAAAQDDDGYLNTMFGRPGQGARWSDLEWGHELYCIGHLVQAAVARARTGHPDDELMHVARRAADLVVEVFGDDGIRSIGGHPEIEPALVELARVTGESSYLDQARRFIDRRGHQTLREISLGRSYFQDDVPVRDATVLRGHAVRATYLAAGALDVADALDDAELARAIARQWAATVARRTYLTGGIGSHHQDEAFGDDFVLPPDRAYSETCAGIGSLMVSWRLLLHDGSAAHADLMERVLFNVVSTAVSSDGTAFFYAHTLHRRELTEPSEPDRASARASTSLRAPWFSVSCCPTNLARTLASLAAYVATTDADGVQIHQLTSCRIDTIVDEQRVALSVDTTYPTDGHVRVTISEGGVRPWTLSLRVPPCTRGARLEVDGESTTVAPGMATIRRMWRSGDTLALHVPIQPRFTRPDPRIDAVRGCVAVERGPDVLCVESVDVPGTDRVDELRIDTGIEPRIVDDRVHVTCRRLQVDDHAWPYTTESSSDSTDTAEIDVALVPYREWGNRGPSTMRVWIPAVE
jgi:DUF1680 family protein